MVFEHRRQPLIPRKAFLSRMLKISALAGAIVGVALGMGTVGYHLFEGMPWLDAVLNASMILSSMGPMDRPVTDGGKIFATLYALASGMVFVTAAGLFLAPALHRLLHGLHLEA